MSGKSECSSVLEKQANHGQPNEPEELTDREVYDTPIGPVCMSRVEHEEYLEQAELQREREETARNAEKG